MNPYSSYANPYGAYPSPYCADASAGGGGGFAGVPYQAAAGAGQSWWGVTGYEGSGSPAGAAGNEWGGAWVAKQNGKGAAGKGGGKSDSKGEGKKGGVMCKFFLEGRCNRGRDCTYSHGDGRAGSTEEEDSDSDMREIEAAIAQVQGEKDLDTANMESLRKAEEEQVSADLSAQQRERWERCSSSGGSDSGDALPPPASEAEIEEARQIVQKAQREAMEREKMKQKAKTASKDDLQAMINARLALKDLPSLAAALVLGTPHCAALLNPMCICCSSVIEEACVGLSV
eukprot:CAMPEP_0171076488 /NCGR_PEP_ID=MMETSP0766_2-20121228/13442_1 /TAXON_ID=439317 /ORGANISM="Gambierdiscus australes, Strain CAWD 149" /LENGTH=285 /DNA_ID=CAMNT_0011533469 /DNA_START=41 /DNA_END=896 /DNA_ORIENTATION=+